LHPLAKKNKRATVKTAWLTVLRLAPSGAAALTHPEEKHMKWSHTLYIVVIAAVVIWASNHIAAVKNLIG